MRKTGYPLVKTSERGIYKRGGRYVVVFHVDGRQRKRFARTFAEARDLKAKLRADIKRGEYREADREVAELTFEQYARAWITSYAGRTSRGIRQETKDEYERTLEHDAIPFLGRKRLVAIGPRDIKAFRAHVASRGVSQSTVRLALAPVKALFADAVEEELVQRNPTIGVRTSEQNGKPAGERVKALRVLELARLLLATPTEHRLLFLFLAQTGLRISEALALRWQDVDIEGRRVHVRRRLYKGRYAAPKSRYGERTVRVKQTMSKALRDRWNEHPTSELVFGGARGGPADRVYLFNRVLKPAARATGLPWVGFHTFRHTCASMLFRKGWNAKQVQMMLGHHSPAFTLATYVHLLPDDLPDPDARVGNRATRPTENGRDSQLVESVVSARLQGES